jgi:ribosomal-protein-alanine N-acetyltransferase
MSAVLKTDPAFRLMLPADIDDVMGIESGIYEFPWTPGNFRDSLAAGYSCWIFSRCSEILGYAVVIHAADEAHLLNLSIAAAWQRMGYGTQLLEHLMAAASEHGAKMLFLEVRPSNQAARQLYARHGFAEIGLRRGYYPARHGREDACVLSRAL